MIFKVIVLSILIGLVAANTLKQDLQDIQIFNKMYAILCQCPREFDPICASNGKTYGNVCQFQCARKSNKYLYATAIGMCSDKNACTPYKASISNCAAKQNRTLKKLYRLTCTSCICHTEEEPVCGSDKKTYGNVCQFKCQQTKNKSLMLLWPGACEEFKTEGIINDRDALEIFEQIYDHNCHVSS